MGLSVRKGMSQNLSTVSVRGYDKSAVPYAGRECQEMCFLIEQTIDLEDILPRQLWISGIQPECLPSTAVNPAGLVDACDHFLAKQAMENGLLDYYKPIEETTSDEFDCLDWSELASRFAMPGLSKCCSQHIRENLR